MNCCDDKPPSDARRLLVLGVVIGIIAIGLSVLSIAKPSRRPKLHRPSPAIGFVDDMTAHPPLAAESKAAWKAR